MNLESSRGVSQRTTNGCNLFVNMCSSEHQCISTTIGQEACGVIVLRTKSADKQATDTRAVPRDSEHPTLILTPTLILSLAHSHSLTLSLSLSHSHSYSHSHSHSPTPSLSHSPSLPLCQPLPPACAPTLALPARRARRRRRKLPGPQGTRASPWTDSAHTYYHMLGSARSPHMGESRVGFGSIDSPPSQNRGSPA